MAKSSINILGFNISPGGIRPLPSLTAKVDNFPQPRNRTEVLAFLNLAGFYRRHVQLFSDLAAPLNDLLKKNRKLEWGTRPEEIVPRVERGHCQRCYPQIS